MKNFCMLNLALSWIIPSTYGLNRNLASLRTPRHGSLPRVVMTPLHSRHCGAFAGRGEDLLTSVIFRGSCKASSLSGFAICPLFGHSSLQPAGYVASFFTDGGTCTGISPHPAMIQGDFKVHRDTPSNAVNSLFLDLNPEDLPSPLCQPYDHVLCFVLTRNCPMTSVLNSNIL